MAASRRGQPPLSVRLPASPAALPDQPDLPPISALFLIDFDVKAGYTIVWKRAVPGLDLEGIVEYKSLPSGLHTVKEDLIYFTHEGGYAGLSAFVNERTDDVEMRHARMIAVGVLVPLSYGRLGRSWRHAEGLKYMASKLAADRMQTQLLEQYWEKNGAHDPSAPPLFKETPILSPSVSFRTGPRPAKDHSRNRSASDGTALIPPGHRLSPYHPAWSLTSLLDTFGPLIFPIHRAALLRKRILISTHAPVHEACNFVYDISVISNIPLSVCDVVEPSVSVQRLRPLFNIGVHDISYLLEHQAAMKRPASRDSNPDNDDASTGWVACTTDSILAIKDNLWDMLITLPPPYSCNGKDRVWPTVEYPKGVPVKATQRDLRRFRALGTGLERIAPLHTRQQQPKQQLPDNYSPHSEITGSSLSTSATTPAAIRLSSQAPPRPGTSCDNDDGGAARLASIADDDPEKIVEPTTWAALAYNGFMWWASAGEQRRSDEVEEQAHDSQLLADFSQGMAMPTPLLQQQRRTSFNAPSGSGSGPAASSPTVATRSGGGEAEAGPADNDADDEEEKARAELAIIAYFHRLTTSILSVLADIVDSADDDDMLDVDFDMAAAALDEDERADDETRGLLGQGQAQGEEEEDGGGVGSSLGWVRVDSDALAHMGLDVWSQSDAEFIRGLAKRYFLRRAYVELKGVEVCGMRVC
ncbi:hypothetical protein B0T22DRAFT_13986 [Podospora appendiculata]|uniref:DUF4484 domain-containing protein n=1 Tax=Podospora appendiculata TaxID=314037 RepID=A0AAE0XFQ7_9PEZI|nr:hypothetical protein B0T22DRAFT_13986 [Podospora appendiculata]